MQSCKSGSNLPSVSRRIDLWNCASIYSSFSWGLHSIVMMSFCICTMIFSIENPNPGNTAPSVSHDPRLAAPIKVCCDRKYSYLNTGHCILYRPRTMYGGGGAPLARIQSEIMIYLRFNPKFLLALLLASSVYVLYDFFISGYKNLTSGSLGNCKSYRIIRI